jgi:putative NADPH-quinone reductase
MNRVFVFVGHPRAQSLSGGLATAYAEAAQRKGAEVRRMDLSAMAFDANLASGYRERIELEPDLLAWQEAVIWASHVALFYPYWWGGMPARLKGVFDRAFLPGFAMRYHEKGPMWDRLLSGRTADVFMTADSPSWWDSLINHAPGRNQVRHTVLEFAGLKVKRMRQFGPVKSASSAQISAWMARVAADGARLG